RPRRSIRPSTASTCSRFIAAPTPAPEQAQAAATFNHRLPSASGPLPQASEMRSVGKRLGLLTCELLRFLAFVAAVAAPLAGLAAEQQRFAGGARNRA